MSKRHESDMRLRPESPAFRPASAPTVHSPPAGPSGNLSPSISGQKWSPRGRGGRPRFNPSRTFHMANKTSKFNPKSTFSPSATPPTEQAGVVDGAFTDLVPKFNPLLADWAALYHPPLHPLQYNLYAPPPFRVRPALEEHERVAEDLFIPAKLRNELVERNEAILQVLPASNLPEFVHVYHSLLPLDLKPSMSQRFGDYPYWRYKVVSSTDGRTYCLLRIGNYTLPKEHSLQAVNKWKRLVSAGVVGVVEAFTTLAFGDQSLIVVHEFWPLARPICEVYEVPPPEGLMWSLAAQLFGAVQAIHKQKLVARIIDSKRVLVTSKDRIRIGSCGALDILDFDEPVNPTQDWKDVAAVLKDIGSSGGGFFNYSTDLKTFVESLESGNSHVEMLAPHLWRVLDGSLSYVDELESQLSTELENGRMVRLLAKLEFVFDRPEYEGDPAWSPQGEKYPLKLFKDFVFHQREEQGHPSIDLARTVTYLNKLDAGIDENILLTSDDHRSRIIVSYKDLKLQIEQVFRELVST